MYQGVMPPLITPIKNGKICEPSVANLIDYLKATVSGYVTTLSSGEGWQLNQEQWYTMVRLTKKYAGNLPVFVGLMRPTTTEVIAWAKIAEDCQVTGIVVTSPFGADYTQDQMLLHYQQVAVATSLPIFIYNESAVSKNVVELATLLDIAKIKSVVGIKESSGSMAITNGLLAANLDLAIFQGWETLCFAAKGVSGYIMALANLEPGMCRDMFEQPTVDRQQAIIEICNHYDLFSDHWYAILKRELVQRGVISTAEVV